MELQGRRVHGGVASGSVRLVEQGGSSQTPGSDVLPRSGPAVLVAPSIGSSRARESSEPAFVAVALVVADCDVAEPLALNPLPTVCGLELDLFRSGDRATVNGDRGIVSLPDVEAVGVVTAFLQRPDGRILLLRRSSRVGSFQGAWAAVSGYLEGDEPEQRARREISEEVGYPESAPMAIGRGLPVFVRDGARLFVVHPFLVRVEPFDVRLDWEHTEFEWADPTQIGLRPTVPKLDRAYASVAGSEPVPGTAHPEKR